MSLDLDNIVDTSAQPTNDDLEKVKKEETKVFGHEEDRFRKDTDLRITLANFFSIVIAFWLLSVILILVGNNCNNYNLSDNVLIALLVTSTANVIGMMIIILKNLFPSNDPVSKNNTKTTKTSSKKVKPRK